MTDVISYVDVSYESSDIGTYVAGLIGASQNGKITLLRCANLGAITGKSFAVGGLVGYLTSGSSIKECYNAGSVTQNKNDIAGGLVGKLDGGTIEDCYNNASVKACFTSGRATGTAGGLAGNIDNGAIKNCYNAGDIVSPNRAGGIVGDARKSATIDFCTNDGNVTLTNTAKVKEDTAAGGIVGHSYDTGTIVGLTVKNCINNGDVSAFIEGNGAGAAGGIVGYVNKGVKDGNTGKAVTVENCINNGKVSGGFEAGGLIGYVFGSNDEYAIITGCINTGDVASASFASGFISYTNHPKTTVKNSISTGKLSALTVEGKTARLSIINLSGANVEEYTLENLFIADGNTTANLSFGNGEDNVKNNIPFSAVDGKDLTGAVVNYEGNDRTIGDSNIKAITRGELNAELITKANTAAGSELFALKDGKVVFASIKAGSSLKSGNNGGSSPPTGDTAAYVAVAAVAAVVILGTALVSKKRVTD